MATRDTTKSTTPGAFTGDDFLDEVAANTKTLYDAAHFPLTSVGGTANAVTAVLDPDFDADGLVDGMLFSLTWATANTGGMTLAINGGAAVPVLDAEGGALIAGAVASGLRSLVEYVGGNFRVLSPLLAGAAAGAWSYYIAITASQTWSKPAWLEDDQIITVEMWGGGAGGGNSALRGGGGGGGYVRRQFRAADVPSSVSISIGAGGAIGAQGGNTTFGALLTAYGGGTSTSDKGGAGASPWAKGANDSTSSAAADPATLWHGGNGAQYLAGNATGGRAIFGGGGGAAVASGGGQTGAGVSIFGGNGGAVDTPGSAPGGGGGKQAVGARGEVRIWI